MPKLRLLVDVDADAHQTQIDPARIDPDVVAEELFDDHGSPYEVEVLDAEWVV